MSGLKTIKDFIKENKAPRGAKYIGVFKDGEENTQKRVDIRYTNLVNNEEDTPLFRFGVLSDVHVNATGNTRQEDRGERMCECKYDFLNAMRYFQENGAKFVCISGDLVLSGEEKNKKNNGMRDWELVGDIMDMYQKSGSTTSEPIPIFSCFGNHDTYDALETFVGSDGNFRLYQSLDENNASYPRIFGTNIYYNDGTFQRLDSSKTESIEDYITWSGDTAVVDDFKRADDKMMNWINKWKEYAFETNNMDKVSGVTNGKVVFQIFDGQEVDESEKSLEVKFGDEVIGINTFDGSGNFKDLNTKTTGSFFFEYNINGETYVFIFFSVYNGIDFESYKNDCDRVYPNIEWLRKVLEHYRNERCFVFIHPPFRTKSGLWGEDLNGEGLYSYVLKEEWAGPNGGVGQYSTQRTREFLRLNELNNHYKNSVWFFGHTHFKTLYQKYFKRANITTDDPVSSYGQSALNIHVPSCAYPRYINGVTETFPGNSISNDFDDSEGLIIDVFTDRIEVKTVWFKKGVDYDDDDNIYTSGITLDDTVPLPYSEHEEYGKYTNKIFPMAFYSLDTMKVQIAADSGNTLFNTDKIKENCGKQVKVNISGDSVNEGKVWYISGTTGYEVKNNIVNKLGEVMNSSADTGIIVNAFCDDNTDNLQNVDISHSGDIRNNSVYLLEGSTTDNTEVQKIEIIDNNLRKVPLNMIKYITIQYQ